MKTQNQNAKLVTGVRLLRYNPKRYELTLECGHVTQSARNIRTVSCGECREARK